MQVYLPGQDYFVTAGQFTWSEDTRVGEFVYDSTFLANVAHRYALDPIRLKLSRGVAKETLQNGIFGVFRDGGPDAWGRDQLYRLFGPLDDFDTLLKGPGDGVGPIFFGDEPHELRSYSLAEIDRISRGFPDEINSPYGKHAIAPTTRMGGAKPKLLAAHDGAFWVAKFPEKGDPLRFLAVNEHVMLSMAKDCGINACDSFVHELPDGRQILLVRRFDLNRTATGVTRLGYASAHTVLGLGDPRQDDGKKKSYLRFADETRRWSGQSFNEEIWHRIVFNALVGNIDDHPKNHALIHDENGWRLSPAFDIVASARPDGHIPLAMSFHKGGAVATPESLLASAQCLGIPSTRAVEDLKRIATMINSSWRRRLADAGADQESIEKIASAFVLSKRVLSHEYTPEELGNMRKRPRWDKPPGF